MPILQADNDKSTTAFGATYLLEGIVVLLLQDFRLKTLLYGASSDSIFNIASYL
jgi:hypothetical protein